MNNTSPRSCVGGLVLRALDSIGAGARLTIYGALIDDVFDAVPPVYAQSDFGNVFRLRSRDASWVASLLASDSYMEGYSASRLWQYASSLSDQVVADSIRRHARDEAKHSRMFAASVFKAFPTLEDPDLRVSLESNTPELSDVQVGAHLLDVPSQEELLNSMMLVNLFEIKALVLCKLMKPVVLAHAPDGNRQVLDRLFNAIERDECQHIRYSASFLEQASSAFGGAHIKEALISFQCALNRVVCDELHEAPTAAGAVMVL